MILENKTAIVTGATRGIGHAIAIRFAKEGCNVAFCGRTRNAAMEAVEQELLALGVKAKGYAADVADYDSAQAFVKEVLADFGNVDILINNAGITDDSAVKRIRTAAKSRAKNRAVMSKINTMRRPVIVTDNASLPEVVSGKVLTVPPNHVDALAYAMERALQDDFQIIPEKRFLVSANLEKHIALYNSILTPP